MFSLVLLQGEMERLLGSFTRQQNIREGTGINPLKIFCGAVLAAAYHIYRSSTPLMMFISAVTYDCYDECYTLIEEGRCALLRLMEHHRRSICHSSS